MKTKLSPEAMDRIVDEHFQFEAQDDVEGVLSTLTRDVDHDVVGWPNGPSKGREEARAFYEMMYADITGEKVTPIKRLYGDGFMIDETLWEGTAPGRPFGCEGGNRPLSFRVLHVFEFSDDGKISRENVWCDLAAIQQQLP